MRERFKGEVPWIKKWYFSNKCVYLFFYYLSLTDAPTDLPNWIELPGVVEKIADTLKIPSKMRKLWREIYLSQASIVLMQDSFWWIFLDYFKDSVMHFLLIFLYSKWFHIGA